MIYLGFDIGQANDPSAWTAVEKLVKQELDPMNHSKPVIEKAMYHCRHLERLPLKQEYPDIVSDMKARINAANLKDNYTLIADATGVGKPVVDYMRKEGINTVPIIITGGSQATYNKEIGGWNVPKKELVSVVQLVLQNRTLQFANTIPQLDLMIQELLTFKIKVSPKGNDTYEAWREGDHDDLVLALAVAVWYAVNYGATGQQQSQKTFNTNPWLIQKGI
jgi:hypothetical protein